MNADKSSVVWWIDKEGDLSVVGQSEAASAQQSAINNQLDQNYKQIALQQQSQENDRLRASRQEDSCIRVAAGEAGLSLGSQSIEMMLLNNQMQTGLASERIGLNTDIQRQNAEAEANHSLSQVAAPTALGAGLQLGLSAANGFIQGQSLQVKRGQASPAAVAKAGA